MSVAFWSAKLSGGKPVEVQPPEGYVLNVQQAAITGEGHAVIKVKTVSVEGDNIEAVIATLRAKTTDQVNLSLVFGYDVPVSFVAEGKADVYLSGYYQPGPEEEGDDEDDENDYDSEEDDEEGSEDDDEEANIRNAEAAIAKLGAARKALKDAPAEDSEDDSEDDDSEEDSEDDSEEEKIDSAFVAKMVAKHGLAPKSSRVEELGSEDESEDESEEESEEEEAPPVKVQKTQAKGVVTPSGQKPKPTTPAHNNNNNKPKTPNGGNNNNNNKTPNNQGGNKNNNNSAHKSGDKRKR